MALILWDRVPVKSQDRYYRAVSQVTPQAPLDPMWHGRLLTPRKDLYQAELRWHCEAGSAQALMVVGLDGWDWQKFEKAEAAPPGAGWNHPSDTRGFTVRMSSNAALWFTTDQFDALPAVAAEARAVLTAVYEEFSA